MIFGGKAIAKNNSSMDVSTEVMVVDMHIPDPVHGIVTVDQKVSAKSSEPGMSGTTTGKSVYCNIPHVLEICDDTLRLKQDARQWEWGWYPGLRCDLGRCWNHLPLRAFRSTSKWTNDGKGVTLKLSNSLFESLAVYKKNRRGKCSRVC